MIPLWIFRVNSFNAQAQYACLYWLDAQNILHLCIHTLWDVIYLGKTLTDLHKGFVLCLRKDNDNVDGDQDAHNDKNQESIILKRLLQNRQKGGLTKQKIDFIIN